MYLPVDTLLQEGRYKILRTINASNFSCTYEAEHVLLEKRMILKEFFLKDFCSRNGTAFQVFTHVEGKESFVSKLKAKFIDEAKSLCRLNHPGIVKISDVFEENGTAYYVMDYIEGRTLSEIVDRQGRLPEFQALKYVRQIADALDYVHAHNLMHLDVRPGNVMIDKADKAILINFGMSRQCDSEYGESMLSSSVNTSGYASPEQNLNKIADFTPATDIYSLGATFYRLLTGKIPPGPELRASGQELVQSLQEISMPSRLAVLKSLNLEAQERPQSVGEFLNIISGNFKDNSISDIVHSNAFKPSRPQSGNDTAVGNVGVIRKNKGVTAIIVTLCVFVILFVGILLVLYHFRGDGTELSGADIQQPDGAAAVGAIVDSLTVRSADAAGGHYYVDLGLSVMWAVTNVGATYSSEIGDYFAWGEISSMSANKGYGASKKHVLEDVSGNAEADAATAIWGALWRTPTASEIKELIDECEWVFSENDGCAGYNVIGVNGNSIFLPLAGYGYEGISEEVGTNGYYWSSTPSEDDSQCSLYLFLNKKGQSCQSDYHYFGFNIRPVVDAAPIPSEETIEEAISMPIKEEPNVAESLPVPQEPTRKMSTGYENGYQWVDIGLGVKWATCNLGAHSPSDFGGFYAWGETVTKSEYNKDNSITYDKVFSDISGNVSYDAARSSWGSEWRLPTYEEAMELLEKCEWIWEINDGNAGYKVTGPNGGAIFLPASGYMFDTSVGYSGENGYYWISSPYGENAERAYYIRFYKGYHNLYWGLRNQGRNIRPVLDLN